MNVRYSDETSLSFKPGLVNIKSDNTGSSPRKEQAARLPAVNCGRHPGGYHALCRAGTICSGCIGTEGTLSASGRAKRPVNSRNLTDLEKIPAGGGLQAKKNWCIVVALCVKMRCEVYNLWQDIW